MSGNNRNNNRDNQKEAPIRKFLLGSKELDDKNAEFGYDNGTYTIIEIVGEERTEIYKSRNMQEAYTKWNVYIGRKKERPSRPRSDENDSESSERSDRRSGNSDRSDRSERNERSASGQNQAKADRQKRQKNEQRRNERNERDEITAQGADPNRVQPKSDKPEGASKNHRNRRRNHRPSAPKPQS